MHDLVCLSHLRWDFVFQRPQHLLSRCARNRRVFFVEEPIYVDGASELRVTRSREGVYVAVPYLERNAPLSTQRKLLKELVVAHDLEDFVLWYYTPMALPLGECLSPVATVYDCMDQLSAFKGAPPELVQREVELMAKADVVFTGGWSLYEAKKNQHHNVYAFPSSVDVAHFAAARAPQADPEELAHIPSGPRLGYFGVIDERMDLELLRGVAEARPDWQFIMVGPVVKISESELPVLPNIHYLGSKPYAELPRYISSWDVALMPFAKNESTKYISPTKTPEYLAAGKPIVSTSIKDVVRPYKSHGLVSIADTVQDFVLACEQALREPNATLLRKADPFLATLSWDTTWSQMSECVEQAILKRHGVTRIAQKGAELPLASGAR